MLMSLFYAQALPNNVASQLRTHPDRDNLVEVWTLPNIPIPCLGSDCFESY